MEIREVIGGTVVTTDGIANLIIENEEFGAEIAGKLMRYINGDFGLVSAETKILNQISLEKPDELYILGQYRTSHGVIFIISEVAEETERRFQTTICFTYER